VVAQGPACLLAPRVLVPPGDLPVRGAGAGRLWLGADAVERVLLVGSLLLVLSAELLNSAIEALIERYGAEHHELAGRAKDMGSAACSC
jgi:diacylglycerol kinase